MQAGLSLEHGPNGAAPQLLSLACAAGHVDVVRWMLDHDVGVSRLMDNGSVNPMFSAVKNEK